MFTHEENASNQTFSYDREIRNGGMVRVPIKTNTGVIFSIIPKGTDARASFKATLIHDDGFW